MSCMQLYCCVGPCDLPELSPSHGSDSLGGRVVSLPDVSQTDMVFIIISVTLRIIHWNPLIDMAP